MFEAFAQGALLGFGVAVPFGPLNILILTYALKSLKNSLAIGFGAMSADILYLVLLLFGVLTFLDNGIFKQILAIGGFVFLTYMALMMLRAKTKDLNLNEKDAKAIQENVFKSFIKGFSLNLLNPFVIAFWLSVSLLFSHNDYHEFMLLGLFVAILLWVCSLGFLVAKFSKFFSHKVIFYINVISAFIIEYFALSLLYKVFVSL